MPRTRSLAWSELKLGVLVMVAIAIAAFTIFAVMGGRGFVWQRYSLKTRFSNVAGLKEGSPVRVAGMEVGNAYTELNDPIMQEATFKQQLAGLPEEDSMAKMDEDFVRALRHGMPPAGGLGVGIDRLVMLLTNTQTIRDVILFPLLRPV